MPKEVAVYMHKDMNDLSPNDVDNGIEELERFAIEGGYSGVTDIEVRETRLERKPATEFAGRPY